MQKCSASCCGGNYEPGFLAEDALHRAQGCLDEKGLDVDKLDAPTRKKVLEAMLNYGFHHNRVYRRWMGKDSGQDKDHFMKTLPKALNTMFPDQAVSIPTPPVIPGEYAENTEGEVRLLEDGGMYRVVQADNPENIVCSSESEEAVRGFCEERGLTFWEG